MRYELSLMFGQSRYPRPPLYTSGAGLLVGYMVRVLVG
jgi:hypothetical protein